MKTISLPRSRRQSAPRPLTRSHRSFEGTFEFLGHVGHCAAAASEIAAAMMLLGPAPGDGPRGDRR